MWEHNLKIFKIKEIQVDKNFQLKTGITSKKFKKKEWKEIKPSSTTYIEVIPGTTLTQAASLLSTTDLKRRK